MDITCLGLTHYQDTWHLQKKLLDKRIKQEINDTLLVCEHHPVITYGKRNSLENLLIDEAECRKRGIDVCKVERGGDITWHGPGQLVCYPILDLNRHKRDVHWYMRMLEEIVIKTLHSLDIIGERVDGKTGVWVRQNKHSEEYFTHRKIASLGVKISKWCTMHGIALNVTNDLSGFEAMHPCGLKNIHMTSIALEKREQQTLAQQELLQTHKRLHNDTINVAVDIKYVQQELIRQFIQTLGQENL